MERTSISPSRTYVATCIGYNREGYFFKKFTLPENFQNDSLTAAWYFLNRISLTYAIEHVFSFEDFSNLTDAEIF